MTLTNSDILNILYTKRPVSITRAGDGELIVLKSGDNLQTYRQCIESVMIRQMGYEPTMGEVDAIRENLKLAYKGADIIGVPMHKNLDTLGKHWTAVQAVVEPLATTGKRTSTDVFYELLYSGELIEWLRSQHTINYIGCRDIDDGLRRLGVRTVNSCLIAPEAKFTSGYDGPKHYPDQFNKMEWWMNAAPCEGNACLVGAGVIGKIYCNWFRDRGGVAIDVGAVMDLLAGFSTRGPERGLDAVNERYKI
jgi:hypothetical protein